MGCFVVADTTRLVRAPLHVQQRGYSPAACRQSARGISPAGETGRPGGDGAEAPNPDNACVSFRGRGSEYSRDGLRLGGDRDAQNGIGLASGDSSHLNDFARPKKTSAS